MRGAPSKIRRWKSTSAATRTDEKKGPKAMNSNEFRKALVKIMPGYKWTVHKSRVEGFLSATGTQSSGFNRLSTLHVTRREKNGRIWFEAKSAGHGTHSQWLYTNGDVTLAKALRGLQSHYEATANKYRAHAAALEHARTASQP